MANAVDPSNPFVHKLELSWIQRMKICLLGAVLLPIRLLFILASLSLATAIARLGLWGLTEQQLEAQPFTGWRLYGRKAICGILRVMFAVCGFWRVRVIGEQATPEEAPILCVAPHSTFFDALAVAVMGAPSVVAKAETRNLPFFGSLIKYTQPLLVHRTDPDSRKNTVNTMKARSEPGPGWQQVLIFPEGTCTNRQAFITFRLGAFIPGVPVQPVILRYENTWDTVTWTWEGIAAWKVLVYSLSQFVVDLSVEFLPPYTPSPAEVAEPQLYSANVRAVMAERMGVPTTDCSYYDYLRINKAEQMVKALRKLQRLLDRPLAEVVESLGDLEQPEGAPELGVLAELCRAGAVPPELTVVTELCGLAGKAADPRLLQLAVYMAEGEDPYEAFLTRSFAMLDTDLGDKQMSESSLQRITEIFLFLPPKEVGEMLAATSLEGVVRLDRLREFIPLRRPNYIKVISKWKQGLSDHHDRLLLPASLTAAAEKATLLMAAGKEVVSDVSASMAARRDKVTDALSSAVTSLHKRTGSRAEAVEKKTE